MTIVVILYRNGKNAQNSHTLMYVFQPDRPTDPEAKKVPQMSKNSCITLLKLLSWKL